MSFWRRRISNYWRRRRERRDATIVDLLVNTHGGRAAYASRAGCG